MIWQSPWSWLGLVALGLPILIHLLGRGRSRVQQFPTLRFIEASRLLPTRRTRLHDLLLLAVRLAILFVAVAALAQPLWRSADRRRAESAAVARAIVVDTSASMRRLSPNGESALVLARREAGKLAAAADASVVLEVAHPAASLTGAASWLGRQAGQRELLVISDFQVGALDSTAATTVPRDVTLRLIQVPVAASTSPITLQARVGNRAVTARITADSNQTDVMWESVAVGEKADVVTFHAAPTDAPGIASATAAARAIGVPLFSDSARRVELLYPGSPEFTRVQQSGDSIHDAWMTVLALRLRSDPLLGITAARIAASPGRTAPRGVVIARNAVGEPLVAARQESGSKPPHLLLLVDAPAGSALSAALIAATMRGLAPEVDVAELEPRTVSAAALAAWQHPATTSSTNATGLGTGTQESDGRWLWLVALLLLAIEMWLRQRTRTTDAVTNAAT